MLRSSNPVFNSQAFQGAVSNAAPARWDQLEKLDGEAGATLGGGARTASRPGVMTVRGTALKTLYLLAITVVTAALSWNTYQTRPELIMPTMIGALVIGVVSGLVMLKFARFASFLVPVFAVAVGAFVAAIWVVVVNKWQLPMAVVGQAAGITFAIAAATMIGYSAGFLRLGGFAKKMVIVMTAGVMIYYVGAFVINMIFGGGTIPQVGWSDGPIGIGFSLFVVVLATLNLLMDYQFIEDGERAGAPKHMEWVAAFGLLTTLVWLYIELLRLLAKLRK